MKRFHAALQATLVLTLCVVLQTDAFANILNTASVTFQDAANTSYGPTASNTVTITTPPLVTAPTLPTLDVGVPMTPVQVVATNSPTSYALSGQPNGISINSTTGLISGTPATGSAGSYTVTVTATNSAGPGTATVALTVHGPATIVLTKTASATTATAGQTVTFTIAYKNTGTGAASNVVITDGIPAGSTLVAGSITGGGTSAGGTITWTLGSVAANAAGSVSFQVTVN